MFPPPPMDARGTLATNERLNAIIAGLDLHAHDHVTAVCGSGDQAFAMLEYADQVLAVDRDEKMISFASWRKQMLAQGNVDAFLSPAWESYRPTFSSRNIYFCSSSDRIEKIRAKLHRLTIQHVPDFVDALQGDSTVPRIYLSNILFFETLNRPYPEVCCYLESIAAALIPGGLLYITDGSALHTSRTRSSNTRPFPRGLTLDDALTSHARSLEYDWKPHVYRR